jgi:hypothetical protein
MNGDRAREHEQRPEREDREQRRHREEVDGPGNRGDQKRGIDEAAVMVGHEQDRPCAWDPFEAGDLHRTEPAQRRRLRDEPHETVGESPHERHARTWRLYDVGVSRSDRLGALCGLLGPVAFTAAWLVAQRRQDEYQVRHEHISGLAAKDANDPLVMTAGFIALGGCTVVFASALERRLGPRPGAGPALIGLAGLATIVAGAFRRDRRSNYPAPGEPEGQSWENDVHDTAAVVGGIAGTVGLVALAPRLAEDPAFRNLARPALGAAGASAGLSTWFLRDVVRPGNGLLQRANTTIPLVFMARLAYRSLREQTRGPGDGRGGTKARPAS